MLNISVLNVLKERYQLNLTIAIKLSKTIGNHILARLQIQSKMLNKIEP